MPIVLSASMKMEKNWKAVDNVYGWALSSVIWDQDTDIVTETWCKIEKGKKTEKSEPTCPAPRQKKPTTKTKTKTKTKIKGPAKKPAAKK